MKKIILVFILATMQVQQASSILLGYYPDSGVSQNISNFNTWANQTGAQSVSIGGTFVSIDDPTSFSLHVNEISAAGAVPFVNLMTNPQSTACNNFDSILSGGCDGYLYNLASGIAFESKKIFIAPFPEMNGSWVFASYYPAGIPSPAKYKQAFIYVRQKLLFFPSNKNLINFVFAPNGWSDPANPFEAYYPGGDYVDVIGFSSFNYGVCSPVSFETGFRPYIERMIAMDPTKPIFITQVGTVGTDTEKAAWMGQLMAGLQNYKSVKALLYFNYKKIEGNCGELDFRLYKDDTQAAISGLGGVVNQESFGRWQLSSVDWNKTFPSPARIFNDVTPISPWIGPDYIRVIYQNGITSGCGGGNYCPFNMVTRAEMAVFLLRAKLGGSYTPPPASHYFTDMAGHWAEAWADDLYRRGIAAGCSGGVYCPSNMITRAELSVLLLRGKYGASYSPPVVPISFSDTQSHWARYWIQNIKSLEISDGCTATTFCPDAPLSRQDMAALLVKAFNIQ